MSDSSSSPLLAAAGTEPHPLDPIAETEVDDESAESASEYADEYPDNDIRMLADSLITVHGEPIADVMAGIRDALEKLPKVVYKAQQHQPKDA